MPFMAPILSRGGEQKRQSILDDNLLARIVNSRTIRAAMLNQDFTTTMYQGELP